MKKYNVAVVGALGAVGSEMLRILPQREFPVENLKPLDIKANEGKTILFNNRPVEIKEAKEGAFKDVDIALFSAGGDASLALAPIAVKEGAIVIDNSSAWRMDPKVPLVVPEVNPQALKNHQGLIANPNCSTIQMVVALKPLHDVYRIRRIIVSTYQAVSGTGQRAIDELDRQVRSYSEGEKPAVEVYPYQIAFNTLPHIDVFLENEYTKEEMKMDNETKKILDESIRVSATAVRVPVFRAHSESINIETEKPIDAKDARDILKKAPGVKVVDDNSINLYPLALDAEGEDEVLVGRIRKDFSIDNGLNLWVVADNLRKGAALNAVQIAEELLKQKLL
ncbi:MAG TPA: aspartate-semialdehyde dehydrogenase [Clostridia bacterium]|nr:aspartate-semialdehyde dehydrogenase [Clostridia bacterium]